MTLMPDLERDLVDAAARASRRRRRRVGLAAVGGAAGAVIAAVLVLAVANDTGGPRVRPKPAAPATPCALGKRPPGARDWQHFDQRPVRSLTVLGCGRLDDGRRVELVIRKFRPRGRCFDIHVMGTEAVSDCAAGPFPEVRPPWIGVSSFTVPGTAASKRMGGALVTGWATGDVRSVELRYRAGGSGQRREVTLIRVTTVPLVLAAGEHTPFGVFVFKPAQDMRGPKLFAHGPNGKELGVTAIPRALRRGAGPS
jgi:hypothetical protein